MTTTLAVPAPQRTAAPVTGRQVRGPWCPHPRRRQIFEGGPNPGAISKRPSVTLTIGTPPDSPQRIDLNHYCDARRTGPNTLPINAGTSTACTSSSLWYRSIHNTPISVY